MSLTNWLALQFVPNELHVLDYSVLQNTFKCETGCWIATYLVEEILDVLLVHPRFNIAYPEGFCADLARLFICQSVVCHTSCLSSTAFALNLR